LSPDVRYSRRTTLVTSGILSGRSERSCSGEGRVE
jgi:hypothetical protein